MMFKQCRIDIRARLAALFRREEIYERADEELQFHLAMMERRMIESGMQPDEARVRARRQLGNAALIQERTLEAWRYGFVETLIRDFRYAVRTLTKHFSFAGTAVLTLALGIGATTAIFSVVYSVLIKPLAYPNADELVRIRHSAAAVNIDDLGGSLSMYLTYRQETRTFAQFGLWSDGGETLTSVDGTERVRSLRVTYGVLQALGVQPLRGRWFTEQEHGPKAEGPAPLMLSYGFWQSRFAGEATALGREVLINGRPSRIVGIMPPDFRFLDMKPQPDVIVAVQVDPARQTIGNFGFNALARLKPGATAAGAAADIERMLPIWIDAWPMVPGFSLSRDTMKGWRITPIVRSLKADLVGGVASALWVLLGAIGAVLLVACANIANLMLVRADARRQEFAVRAALGAVPARIARELIVESLVIGAAGGLLGLGLAYIGLRLLVAIGPGSLPRLNEISVYPPVLAFTAAVSIASALGFGSMTALKCALHVNVSAFIGARGSSAGREHSRTRSTLVIIEVALALVLVVSAVLMIRTFQALHHVDPGFVDPASIQTLRTWAPNELIRDAKQFTRVQHEILDAIKALPGVTAAGYTSTLPMEGPPFVVDSAVVVEGRTPAAKDAPRRSKFVSPGYFGTMGTRIIAGRDITWADIESGGRVALISEDFARELAPEPAAALGKRIRPPVETDEWREVIGVVQNVKEDALYTKAPSLVYWPVRMERAFGSPIFGGSPTAFVVRSERTGTESLVNEMRQAIRSVNGNVPIALPRTMQDLYGGSLSRTSFALVILTISGVMALALGVIGIYAVISYVVSQRAREIGIRIALGAQRGEVRMMFLQQGVALSAVGVGIGLVAALALTRFMTSLLFGIQSMDPPAYLAALGVILAAAALASYVPAWRASAIDPVETLKAE
jgi:putative ABC transport system permease protein